MELIGEPDGYRWNRLEVEERLTNKIEEQKNADLVTGVVTEEKNKRDRRFRGKE